MWEYLVPKGDESSSLKERVLYRSLSFTPLYVRLQFNLIVALTSKERGSHVVSWTKFESLLNHCETTNIMTISSFLLSLANKHQNKHYLWLISVFLILLFCRSWLKVSHRVSEEPVPNGYVFFRKWPSFQDKKHSMTLFLVYLSEYGPLKWKVTSWYWRTLVLTARKVTQGNWQPLYLISWPRTTSLW